jgi:putative membrane protein
VTVVAGFLPTVMPFAHAGHAAPLDPLAWLPAVLVVTLGCAVYLVGVLGYRSRRGRSWSPWRTASWFAGAALVALAVSPALAAAGDARSHMVQHLLLGMLAPLGLVLGSPVTLLLGATPPYVGRAVAGALRNRVFHVVGHPVAAAVLNVGGMFALYLTPLYAATADSALVHHLVHAHFLAAGYLFTWSIAGPDPAPRRPGIATRVVVLVLAAGAHSYLGKLLYARAGELPRGAGHTVGEMEVAAQWMYYGGDVAELLLAAALFAVWYRPAGRRGRRTPAPVAAPAQRV